MKKMKKLTRTIAAIMAAVGFTWVAVDTASRQNQPHARKLNLSEKINRITTTSVSDVSFEATEGQSIHDWYVNEKGAIFAVFKDPTAGYVIRVFTPNGSLATEFSCTGPVWEPRIHIWYIAADDAGNIYAAVEWSFSHGGIIVVDSRGGLVSKLKLTDFKPSTIAVDRDKRIWVTGWEITLAEPGRQPTHGPNAEQIRVYDQSLKLLDIPVRNIRREKGISWLTASDNEVMYYAMGTNELYIFRDGKLADKLLVGEVPRLELPLEAKGKDVEVLRGILGVFKLDEYLVLAGFYSYNWKDQGVSRHAGRNFMVLINPEEMTISAELEAPRGGLSRSSVTDGLIYLSGGGQQGAYKLTRTNLIF
jgi:hypothetical protein